MRTPLTSISSYTELMLGGTPDPEEATHFLSVIARNAETLRVIIDDLLDLAGLESGYVTLTEHPFNVASEVRDVLRDSAGAALDKGLSLDSTITETATMSGDAARIRQVIDHLVSNAIKYTP